MSDRYASNMVAEGGRDDSPTNAVTLLDNCRDATAKLAAKITELEDRLEPVRVPVPDVPKLLRDETTPVRPIRSRLVNDLDDHLDRLRDLQRHVSQLTEQVEL